MMILLLECIDVFIIVFTVLMVSTVYSLNTSFVMYFYFEVFLGGAASFEDWQSVSSTH